MKKIMIIWIFVIILIIGLCGCNEEKDQTEDPLKNLEYINDEYNFGINPPENWTINQDNVESFVVLFIGPTEKNYQVNLGISIPETLASDETLDNVVDEINENYPIIFTENLTWHSKGSKNINGLDAYEIVFSYNYSIYHIKQKQVLILKNNIVYTFTYSALTGTYNNYISSIDETINSFTVD